MWFLSKHSTLSEQFDRFFRGPPRWYTMSNKQPPDSLYVASRHSKFNSFGLRQASGCKTLEKKGVDIDAQNRLHTLPRNPRQQYR